MNIYDFLILSLASLENNQFCSDNVFCKSFSSTTKFVTQLFLNVTHLCARQLAVLKISLLFIAKLTIDINVVCAI